MSQLTLDGVLGGIEHVRNQLQDLMLAVEVSFPGVHEKLDEIDTALLDLSDSLEDDFEPDEFDADYDEIKRDLAEHGMITVADVDDLYEAYGDD
jgi:hypothetical protein